MSDHTAPPPEQRLERGRRLALDVGTVRIGVAVSDPDGILATPHATVRRQEGADVREIAQMAGELDARVVYVGLPRTLRGGDSASTSLAREVAAQLARVVAPVEVRLVDERLSTVDASRMMRASGRSARSQRAEIDSAAAVVILQTALDAERASVTRAGQRVDEAQLTLDETPGRARKPRHRRATGAPAPAGEPTAGTGHEAGSGRQEGTP